MTALSVLIPSRNEMFLVHTIADLLKNIRADTEIIAVLDGQWSDPPIPDHPKVTLVYHPESIGQRAATNEAARIARGKYLMKVDAHCAFDEGFDAKLLADMQEDWTVAPLMKNLHVFDWVCESVVDLDRKDKVRQEHTRYQGPSGPCKKCGKPTVMDVVWFAKRSPNSTAYCFDAEPHFQYFGEFRKRPEGRGEITESMSLQGSAFMISRDRYFELDICDERWGNWGSQGIEVACKTWLSGGKVMINHKTWYAHCFRTQGGDFGFPYPLSGRQIDQAKQCARNLFFENRWEKQVLPLSWLVEKFWPVPGWKDADLEAIKAFDAPFMSRVDKTEAVPVNTPAPAKRALGLSQEMPLPNKNGRATKGMIYYSDCQLDDRIACSVRWMLQEISREKQIPIVSATLKKMDFGVKNIHFPSLKRGHLTMFKQIRAALEHSKADIIFFCEHDVLYPPDHFDFIPERDDRFYYNLNFWKVDAKTGRALHYDAMQTSGLCAYRKLLLAEYEKIIRQVERDGYSAKKVSFEPGSRDHRAETWCSDMPLLDIRHEHNLTPNRWRQDQFRDPKSRQNWQETDHVPEWYKPGEFGELIGGHNGA